MKSLKDYMKREVLDKKQPQDEQQWEDFRRQMKTEQYGESAVDEANRMTASEILYKQLYQQESWKEAIQADIDRMAKEMATAMIDREKARLNEERITRIIDETVLANPGMNHTTAELAKVIISRFPKMNMVIPELLFPYVLAVAQDIQNLLDEKIPEEWK